MRSAIFFLLLLLSAVNIYAAFPNNEILGKIVDAASNAPVKGAAIAIVGSTKGAISEADGTFILNVQGLKYVELKISANSFDTKNIIVSDSTYDRIAGITIQLEPRSEEMKEVTVNAVSRRNESISGVYIMQRNSASISDGISAEVIRKSPDRSTSDVLKRVSGTTIEDNKFVIIRGLSDRYNFGLSDGSLLPSTEPNRKAFSFDIIPASMIDNIIITKSGTPDLPADFAGGVINILTKEVPTRDFNNISVGVGYNTASTFKNFLSGYRSKTDFLGFDDGSRQLPAAFPSTGQILQGFTQEQSNQALASLNNDFALRAHKALPTLNLQADMGRVRLFNNGGRFGFTGGITYSHAENIRPNTKREYDGYAYNDNVYNYYTNLGGLLNFSYQKGSGKYALKTLYNNVFNDNFLYRTGYDEGRSSLIQYFAYDLNQKSLFKTSFNGNNKLGKKDILLDYNVALNRITNKQPDQRKVSYGKNLQINDAKYAADITTIGKANQRLWGDLDEKIYTANVNLSIPVQLLNDVSTIKIGGSATNRHRDFSNRYIGATLTTFADQDIRYYNIDRLFSPEVIAAGSYRLEDGTDASDAYTADTKNFAGYAMMDTKLSQKFRLVWGARYEVYNLEVTTAQSFTKKWSDFLPSANLTYKLSPQNNLRASYFRSLARPEFREIVPLIYYDFERNAMLQGNDQLLPSKIDNFDLKYEIFPNSGEIISLGVFYKHFINTLETSIYKGASTLNINTVNFPSATNIGVEAEIRKNLGFISEGIKNFDFYTNVALIKSTVELGQTLYILDKELKDRPLTGQSPYSVNSSLGYTSNNRNFTANLFYNIYGQRINLVGGQLYGMIYESPRNMIDAQVAYKLSEKSELKLNIKDMLNQPIRFYVDQNVNKQFDGSAYQNGAFVYGHDWIFQSYKPGSSFTLTYTLRL